MRSKWFEGFLWAEATYVAFGPQEGEGIVDEAYDEESTFGEFTDFERGALAYTILMRMRQNESVS